MAVNADDIKIMIGDDPQSIIDRQNKTYDKETRSTHKQSSTKTFHVRPPALSVMIKNSPESKRVNSEQQVMAIKELAKPMYEGPVCLNTTKPKPILEAEMNIIGTMLCWIPKKTKVICRLTNNNLTISKPGKQTEVLYYFWFETSLIDLVDSQGKFLIAKGLKFLP